MRHLFNYCPIDWYEDEMARRGCTLDGYLNELGLDGIEQFVYGTEQLQRPYKRQSVGVHLNYWPYWMDFWLQKRERLQRLVSVDDEKERFFLEAGGVEVWLERIRRNIRVSLDAEPEYFVWHVGQADDEEIFTYKFNYTDRQVLGEMAKVFNAVADEIPEHITVLFENLWWPGLRLVSAEDTAWFFSLLRRDNCGIMLDTGHLLNTNPGLRTEEEAAAYICSIAANLGEQAKLIRGVHLSCSLSGEYQSSFERRVPDKLDRVTIWKHIVSLDRHQPFATKAAARILERLQPEYVVHELSYDSMADMAAKVAEQLENCR